MSCWRPIRGILLATSALAPLSLTPVALGPALANPQGAQVVGGAATIQSQGSTLTVTQTTDRAIINWQTFNIGSGDTTRFVQPGSSSIALNRVTGGFGPSFIDGTLTANGRVFIINADGIMIGAGARIDTAGFLATTNDIRNADFMGGNYVFSIPGRPDASIVNAGTITAANFGFAGLVAPGVRNSGTITATFGKIGLASGNGFTLDFYGDKLITLAVNDSIAGTVKDVATGKALTSLVSNDGTLKANGGTVQLTAVAARQVVDSVINNKGVIEARSIGKRNGKIVLGGPTATTKVAGAPTQTVKVSGKLDVSGKKKGQTGGTIQVTGENIVLASAKLDASGSAGGGKVLIGGDVGGGNPSALAASLVSLEAAAIPNATSVSVDAATTINASAIASGNGGKVVVWADGATAFAGAIKATGGASGGNGGFVETSGRQTLAFNGTVDTSAPHGQFGNLLLDPGSVTIVASGGDTTTPGTGSFTGSDTADTTLTASTLTNALATSNVIVQTGTVAGFGTGDIIVSGQVSWGSGTTLTLSAYRNIQVNSQGSTNTATIDVLGSSSLVLRADNTGTGTGTLILRSEVGFDRRIDATATTGTVTVYYNPTSYALPTDFTAGNGRIYTNSSVVNQLTSYMLVNNVTDLQDVSTNLSGNYALGRDVDAVSVVNFAPIGGFVGFTGQFDGLNHSIQNLTIAPTSPSVTDIGLFSRIDTGGVVKNLDFTNASITANPNAGATFQNIGVLAGVNYGTVDSVTAAGTINGGSTKNLTIGGLVGMNAFFNTPATLQGTINNSSANVAITAGDGTCGDSSCVGGVNNVGGLVGFNPGIITSSSASGAISVGANTFAGGLVGINQIFSGTSGPQPLIRDSWASGNVVSTGTDVQLGGLVGYNYGTNGSGAASSGLIQDSRASGNVTANTAVPGVPGGCDNNCQYANVGGLVGFNEGTIEGTVTPSGGTPVSFGTGTYATGAISVSSNAKAGGLVGQSDGVIDRTAATGAVTAIAGSGSTDNSTALGGLVGSNQGTISNSSSSGDVGALGIAFIEVGGLAGDNAGTIANSSAIGAVRAGDNSAAGGLAAFSSPGNFNCTGCTAGLGFNNLGTIADSTASGSVTVGSASLAGGLAAAGGDITRSSASGAVTGGDNSILGGLLGVLNPGSTVTSSSATGAVTSTGSNSWIGGLVGANAGYILASSFASGAVQGTSDSVVGGLVGFNIGQINTASTSSIQTVSVSGGDNLVGGLVGANFGSIINSTSNAAVSDPPTNTLGSLVGANGNIANVAPNQVAGSSFPLGTIDSLSVGNGTVNGLPGSQVGSNNLTSIPVAPSVLKNCDDSLCQIIQNPNLIAAVPAVPDDVLAPLPIIVALPDDHADQIGAAILTVLTTPDTPPGGGNAQPAPPPTPPGQPYAPPAFLRPVTGPDGERFSSIPPVQETRFFNDQVVLQVPANVPADEILRIARELGLSVLETQNVNTTGGVAFRLGFANGRSIRAMIRALERNRITVIAQPNYKFMLVQPAGTDAQNDSEQYTVNKLHLDEVHKTGTGRGVTIAVIDSEVDQTHSELVGVVSEELNILGAPVRAHSHGTAMVGAIASRDRLKGVAPGAKVIAVRAFGETAASAEGTTYNILKGLEWAESQGARVINMSFAGPYDPSLARAFKAAADRGIVLISAAGNAGPKSPPLFPGADPNVIAVTATDSSDRLFRMANQGGYVAVAAPGVDVLAPAPEEAYQMSTGTSIATAHVTGVVALMLERDPSLKPADVRKILETTSTDLGTRGRDNQFGWGLVNPQKALAAVDARKKSATSAPR